MANSTATRLQKVRDAIDALMDGGAVQSCEINGRQLSHCSLAQLMDLEKRLIAILTDGFGQLPGNLIRGSDESTSRLQQSAQRPSSPR